MYTGGDIITVAGREPAYAEAVAVRGGRIAFVGARAAALAAAGPGAAVVDLASRAMVPGFVDSHAHMLLAAHNTQKADLKGVASIPELVGRLKKHAATVPPGAWIEGGLFAK